jgi:hypothetical protein
LSGVRSVLSVSRLEIPGVHVFRRLLVFLHCDDHHEKFNLYCKEHERPCCRICNLENHKDCKNVAIMEEIIKNVKTSTMLNRNWLPFWSIRIHQLLLVEFALLDLFFGGSVLNIIICSIVFYFLPFHCFKDSDYPFGVSKLLKCHVE